MRIGLCDRLEVRLAPPGALADTLAVDGLPGTPVTGNLVLRAFDALRAHAGQSLPPLEAKLDKQIPAAAGLGGGSSDAAAALVLAQKAWGIYLAPDEVSTVGAGIGSDVPFFLADETLAEVGGRGEIVNRLPSERLGLGLLVVTPPIELNTARVFVAHDQIPSRSSGAGAASDAFDSIVWEANDQDILDWSRQFTDTNDLWPAAVSIEPSLGTLRTALERATERPWLMSGSGPTLFAIYASVDEAAEAGRQLIAESVPELQSAVINAVDLFGPDPKWRYP
jgi:4-diphosphocytidyl-2-C-methyl-D-erythritol kinase